MNSQMRFDFGEIESPKTQAMSVSKGSQIQTRSAGTENPAWWTPIENWVNSFGGGIGLNEALRQTAFLICLDVLASDISKATLRLKRRVKGDGSVVVEPKQHPLAEMLALEPNIRHTWPEYTSMMVYHYATTSNAYSYVRRKNDGDALELIPLIPGRVEDKINPGSRETFYDITASTMHEVALLGATKITAPERDVIHVRNRMLDGFFGYSTLSAGVDVLKKGKALSEYETKLFDKDAGMKGVFVQEEDGPALTDEAFRRLQSQLKLALKRASDNSDVVILERKLKFVEMAMKANEAEMSKSLSSQIESICQLLKMPPHKAMHLASVKYENLATMEQQYAKNTLYPICENFEARFARTLLTPKERLEFFFEFDRDELSMADEKVEIEWVKAMLDRSAIEIDEARALAGWNPMSKNRGKVRLIPANGVLIDENNEVVAAGAAAQGADASSEGTEEQQAEQDEEKQKGAGLRLVKA